MATIRDYLSKILNSVYGKDVRQAIHDAIHQCYLDGKTGAIDLIAREQIDTLIAHSTDSSGNSELIDIRVGADGTSYTSAGQAVRQQVQGLKDEDAAMPDNILNIHVWEKFSDSYSAELEEKKKIGIVSWTAGVMGNTVTVSYSENISRDNGVFVLSEPVKSIAFKANDADNVKINKISAIKGKYIAAGDNCYKIDDNASFYTETIVSPITSMSTNDARKVMAVKYSSSYGYVTSSNKYTYPVSGEKDGYRFEYRCKLGEAVTKIMELV